MKQLLTLCAAVAVLAILNLSCNAQTQTYLSEIWTGQGGQMAMFYSNATKTDLHRNVYVAGSTFENNNDMITQKFSRDGTLIWQHTFNRAANMDDMAADLFIDNDLNVYVTGTSIASVANDFDLIVLKYSPVGQLLWTRYYNNNGMPQPVCIP